MSKATNSSSRMPVLVAVEQDGDDGGTMLSLQPFGVSVPDEDPAETEVSETVEINDSVDVVSEDTEAPSEPAIAEVNEEAPQEHDVMAVTYTGFADVYEHGEFRFRRGQPVTVPSDIAVKLLSNRTERFVAVKE